MHDYEDDDQFDVYDWCDADIDIPELSEDTDPEVRSAVSPSLLRRLHYNAGPAGAPKTFALNLGGTGQDRVSGEDAEVSSPRTGNSLDSGFSTFTKSVRAAAAARAWSDASFTRLWSAVLAGGIDNSRTDETGVDLIAREQMTTIVVQVKHAPLTEQALACGAASALTAKIDSIPIVDAVRRALESLYDSIGDPPRGPSGSAMVRPAWFEHAPEEGRIRQGEEPSDMPPRSVFLHSPDGSNAAQTPEPDDARSPINALANDPKAVPASESGDADMLTKSLANGSLSKVTWTYPVTDVDVIVALQCPLDPVRHEADPDDASTEAVDQLRRGIREVGRAVNCFPRTHRTAAGEVYAADPSSGGESLVVVTGDLCPGRL